MITEIWKPIPDFDGYEVSDQGNVRSYKRSSNPRKLKPSKTEEYLGVALRRNGSSYRFKIASLVMLAFVGPRPSGMDICHNNSNPIDNRLENLRYDTRRGNLRDRLPLSDTQVIEMRERRWAGESIKSLAQLFGLSNNRINDICQGKTYTGIIGGPITTTGRTGKLLIAEVVAIRERYARGEITMRELGKEYNLSESAISYICSGKRYKDDGGPVTR